MIIGSEKKQQTGWFIGHTQIKQIQISKKKRWICWFIGHKWRSVWFDEVHCKGEGSACFRCGQLQKPKIKNLELRGENGND
jgi:hypothetical protein